MGEEDIDVNGACRSRNISVAIRLRPLLKAERKHGKEVAWVAGDPSPSCIRDLRSDQALDFDHVFKTNTSTPQLFEACVADIVRAHCEGYNGAIFAYGQTASGKTFTMYGEEEKPGVIQLAVENIFNYIESHPDRNFMMELAYLEIYNEQVFDLRAPASSGTGSRTEVQVLENEDGESVFKGLSWLKVSGLEDIRECLEVGAQRRHTGETAMNERSSRSHTILRIKLQSMLQDCSKTVLSSMLDLVDLAGSEGLRHTEATGERRREGKNINTSLLALSQVIKVLSDKSRSSNAHISFRDSKLTRILRPSIGGNSQTVIICAVSPAAVNYSETKSTLEFASRARSVCNKVRVNRITKDDDGSERIRNLCSTVSKLQAQLQKVLEEGELARTMRGENEQLKQETEELESKLARVQSRVLSARNLQEISRQQKVCEDERKLNRDRHANCSTHTTEQEVPQRGGKGRGSTDTAAHRRRSAGKEERDEDEKEVQQDANAARARAMADEIARLRAAMDQARVEASQLEFVAKQRRKMGAGAQRGQQEDLTRVSVSPIVQKRCRSPSFEDSAEEAVEEDGMEVMHDQAAQALATSNAGRRQRSHGSRSPRRDRFSHAQAPSLHEGSGPLSAATVAPLTLPAALGPDPASKPGEAAQAAAGENAAALGLLTNLLQRLSSVVPGTDLSDRGAASDLPLLLSQVQAVVNQSAAGQSSRAASSAAPVASVASRACGSSSGVLGSSSRESSPVTDAESNKSPPLEERQRRLPATPLQNHRRKRQQEPVEDAAKAHKPLQDAIPERPKQIANVQADEDEALRLQRQLEVLERQAAEMRGELQARKEREAEKAAPEAARDMDSLYTELQEMTRDYEELMAKKSQQAADEQKRSRRAQAGEARGRSAPAAEAQHRAQRESAASAAAAAAASKRAEVEDLKEAVSQREKEVMARGALLQELRCAQQRSHHQSSADAGSDEDSGAEQESLPAVRHLRARSEQPTLQSARAAADAAKAEAQSFESRLAACRRGREEAHNAHIDEHRFLKKPRTDEPVLTPRPWRFAEQEADEVLRAWSGDRALPIQDGCVHDPSGGPAAVQDPGRSPRRRLSGSFEQAAAAPRSRLAPQGAASRESETLSMHITQQQEKLKRLHKEQVGLESRHTSAHAEVAQQQQRREDLRMKVQELPGAARAAGASQRGERRSARADAAGGDDSDPGRAALEALIASRNAGRVEAESRLAAMKQDIACSRPELLSVTQAERERQVQQASEAEKDCQQWKTRAKELEMQLAAAQRQSKSGASAVPAQQEPPSAASGGELGQSKMRMAASPKGASAPAPRARQHTAGRKRNGDDERCPQQ